ncbi:MAG: hypothetical protein JRG70_10410 [Deltaproteobacteria bacterium]|nr:hypothetical protein [Deltaproteobacteria bacterium]
MDFLVRLTAVFALSIATVAAVPAAADWEGPNGYGTTTSYELDVSHDGYVRDGQEGETAAPATYVVIEAESGTAEQVDGETIIVVQEPEPTAATEAAPPPPRTVVVEQPVVRCTEGIWVDGYWSYTDGDYLWVEGHCVVERVNYVFVHPRWDYYANVWWFVPGYYRPYGVYVGFGYYRPWHWYPPYYHPYYRSYHPVPVYRGVPRRPTTVRAAPVPRASRRGVVPRPSYRPARTSTVGRVGGTPTRTGTVSRAPTRTVTRAPTVTRTVTRAPTVTRTVTRPPTIRRAPTVTRPPSSRAGVVGRTRTSPMRTGSVSRPPSAPTSRGAAARPSTSRTNSVRRPSTSRTSVRRPGSGPSRGGNSGRSGIARPSSGPSRGGSFNRPSFGVSRPSVGRGGGFSRPSSGNFGGSRSVPTARGR